MRRTQRSSKSCCACAVLSCSTGFRGSPAVDLDGVARAASLIGTLLLSLPEITEIDVNPLIAHPRGQGVTALDALIVTQ